MKTNIEKILLLLEAVGLLVCTILFVLLMADIWDKYRRELTSTGIR